MLLQVYSESNQLMLFVQHNAGLFRDPSKTNYQPILQSQPAVTAYLKSKLTRRSACQYSMSEENPVLQRQTAVYVKSKQLLLLPLHCSILNKTVLCLLKPVKSAHLKI